MGTTVAVSDEVHTWLKGRKADLGVSSLDDVLADLTSCGQHMIERLMRRRREAVEAAAEEHDLRQLTAFGSRVWGAPHARSDVDLVAEFACPVGYFELVEAQEALAEAFGVPVDLTTWASLRPRLHQRVRDEGVPLLD